MTAEEWRDRLSREAVVLSDGVSARQLGEAQLELGVEFPHDLVEFLHATDGLYDSEAECHYGWSVHRIVAENQGAWARNDCPLSGDLLAFGEDGAGGWFCISLTAPSRGSVFHWSWIECGPAAAASDLGTFWAGWLSGELSV
jgi:cell wall assembly regulator SMI1